MRHTFYLTVGADNRFRRFLKSSYLRKNFAPGILFDGRLELWFFWVHIQVWRKSSPPYNSLKGVPTVSVSLWERNIIRF